MKVQVYVSKNVKPKVQSNGQQIVQYTMYFQNQIIEVAFEMSLFEPTYFRLEWMKLATEIAYQYSFYELMNAELVKHFFHSIQLLLNWAPHAKYHFVNRNSWFFVSSDMQQQQSGCYTVSKS